MRSKTNDSQTVTTPYRTFFCNTLVPDFSLFPGFWSQNIDIQACMNKGVFRFHIVDWK